MVMGNVLEGKKMEGVGRWRRKKEGEWEKQRNMLIFPSPWVVEIEFKNILTLF